MPKGNGIGPTGQGPMTGRGRGYCTGFNIPGFANSGFGRGFGLGRRIMPIQPQVITEQQEKEILEQELELIKQEMNEIQKRLKELK
ncbi:MAG TPA: DUF5320 domain-containing protein [Bacillota bacterium]|nr:DUF5320 domain-containing protein [Bacillota bacterium]